MTDSMLSGMTPSQSMTVPITSLTVGTLTGNTSLSGVFLARVQITASARNINSVITTPHNPR